VSKIGGTLCKDSKKNQRRMKVKNSNLGERPSVGLSVRFQKAAFRADFSHCRPAERGDKKRKKEKG